MTKFKKIVLGLIVIAAVFGGILAVFGERIILATAKKQVIKNLSGQTFAKYKQGLNVVLCGAGSPLPDPTRAGPCVAVIAGDEVMIFDVGGGAVRNLVPFGIPPGKVSRVFLTHFHSDHIDGLGELLLQRWVGASHKVALPVHGPEGVQAIVSGLETAYAQDSHYRVVHHGEAIIPASGFGGTALPFLLPPVGTSMRVLDQNGVLVTAFAVDHGPVSPAVGYRIEYKGRSVVISGDTRKSSNLQKFAQNSDLLVHEALNSELVDVITAGAVDVGDSKLAQITRDIHNYHTTPVEAAEVAAAASAKHLLFYHIVPALPVKPLERLFIKGVAQVYKGGVTVGRDGTWVQLPPQTSEINIRQVQFGD